jgi:hypothetical protein
MTKTSKDHSLTAGCLFCLWTHTGTVAATLAAQKQHRLLHAQS